MPSDAATAIAYVGAFVGLVGGGVALFNSWKAVSWKRAELANSYLKDFSNTPELVFAGRCLDWQGGKLVLPENLRPYMPNGEEFIQHDKRIFAIALSPNLMLGDMDDDPRIMIYRTSMDSFLTWLCLVASGLERKLFLVADLQDVDIGSPNFKASQSLTTSFVRTATKKTSTSWCVGIGGRRARTKTGCLPLRECLISSMI
jgi:hypothetical protein